jgi:hypothetical protein
MQDKKQRRQSNKRWYNKYRQQKLASNQLTRKKYLQDWIQYCQVKFGDPVCEICRKELTWFSGDITNSVNFDHRHGGQELIKTKREGHASVNNWLRSRPCNDKNRKIFESCDFGILCQRCNQFLPTLDREDWIRKTIKYVFGNNVGLLKLEEVVLPLPDWEY